MFFALSKILIFFLVPFWWVVILLIWFRLARNPKTKKILKVVTICILIVFTNPFIYRSLVSLWQPSPIELSDGKSYEAGILLGGLAGYDKNNRGYFGNNADRFIQSANLYHRGIIKKVIISGGTGALAQDEPAESFFLRRELLYNGVKAEDIFIDSTSRNTFENAVFTKKIIDSLHLQPPFVLITSALHMRRSMSVFKKANFECIAFPCDYKVTAENISLWDIIPNISLLNDWTFFLKEIVGLYVYKATGKA